MSTSPTLVRQVLDRDVWEPRAAAHRERARTWTAPHLLRRERHEPHPVVDFLFEYYNLSPAQLERWHPGLDVGLADAPEHAALGAYVTRDGVSTVDPRRLASRVRGLRWTRSLLTATLDRPARYGCFGLHEWAMVYRSEQPRHDLPLRLGRSGTDAVVEAHPLTCTHVDAFRFFTPAAEPRNAWQLGREHQLAHEQPGCLHANMDLYRIAFRLLPFVESTVVLDAFELALEIRTVDMQASPYDVGSYGLDPIPVEVADGRAEYVRRQRDLAARAEPLRRALLAHVDRLLAHPAAHAPEQPDARDGQ
ncbi:MULTISPECIES: 3-methyladenine DNA glycosylase [unclassified Aeromicrobium]|uniref:3-methyladenine DNA glycosylase n=1 Tax=unclassified Aeromicrobium TaxID=2633570 RepID=UPI000A6F6891|nr:MULTISPECIES: 3-methyladenine DNA glycosylase [unclassified Aeromicrobium]